MNIEKLQVQCAVLEKLIVNSAEIYNEATDSQKALIATTIGAAIFYLSTGKQLYSGKISEKAYEALRHNPKTKLTKDHCFPRKKAGEELLTLHYEKIRDGHVHLIDLYLEEYGKYNFVLPEENKALIKFQKTAEFRNAYQEAGIHLIEMPINKL
jgi:hypothetical protein